MLQYILTLISFLIWAITGAFIWAVTPVLLKIIEIANRIHHFFQ
jgi:hypothetical protein